MKIEKNVTVDYSYLTMKENTTWFWWRREKKKSYKFTYILSQFTVNRKFPICYWNNNGK